MGDVYYVAYYHLIWATKNRLPLLTPEVEPLLRDKIRRKCAEQKIVAYALNGMPDHVHVTCSIPPSLSLSDAAGALKGSSSHFLNRLDEMRRDAPEGERVFEWQSGFGMVTFSRSDWPRVVRYIENQKQHHASSTLWPSLERISTEEEYPLPQPQRGLR